MRLPGGSVAYQSIRAGEVVAGLWIEVDGDWKQVTRSEAACGSGLVRFKFDTEPDILVWHVDEKVKVASTVDGARLAAERKAMQAEAYDQACEART